MAVKLLGVPGPTQGHQEGPPGHNKSIRYVSCVTSLPAVQTAHLMTLLQAPHRGVRLLAANLSALWDTPLATGENGAGLGVTGAGLGAAALEGLGMNAGGGGAAWGRGCIFTAVVVGVLFGSNLSAKLRSDTHGGLLEEAGAAGAGAGPAAGGWG